MDKENFMKAYGRDLAELKISGVLNYDLYKTCDDAQIKAFVARQVHDLALKFVSLEWEDIVNVRCEYVLIDSYYNTYGKVVACTDYTHANGCGNVIIAKTRDEDA